MQELKLVNLIPIIFIFYAFCKILKLVSRTKRINDFTKHFYCPKRDSFFGAFIEFVTVVRKSIKSGSISEEFLNWRLSHFLKSAEKSDQSGAWVFKTLPWRQLLYVTDPKLVEFLTDLDPKLVTRGGFVDTVLLTDENGFTDGLVMIDNNAWQEQRKIIQKVFKQKNLEKYISPMDESARDLVTQLSAETDFHGKTFEIARNYIYEVLFKCLFGDRNNSCQTSKSDDNVISVFTKLGSLINWKVRNIPLIILVRKIPILGYFLKSTVAQLQEEQNFGAKRDNYINKMIKSAKNRLSEGFEPEDITSILVNEKKNAPTLTEKNIRAHLFTLLFAGHETSLAALHWCFYHLGQNAEYRTKIAAEFESLGGQVTQKTLQHAVFTQAFINEVLRLRHVVDMMVPRQLLTDVRLPDGKIMPAGMQFIIDLGAIHRENHFVDPLKFDPYRFIDQETGDLTGTSERRGFIPFGAGRRNCVGRGFAIQMLKIALFRVSSSLKIENIENNLENHMEGVSWKPKANSLKQKFTTF